MRKLIVGGVVLDLSNDSQIALTKEINSLWDFKDRRSNLTNTFTLPYTITNNQYFSHANDLTITSIDFRNFHECYYIQDYIQIISYGKLKLTTASAQGYEVAIAWGNIDLSETLGDKTLQDLNLDDLKHNWTHANVIANYVPAPAPAFECLYPFYNPSGIDADLFALGTVADPLFSSRFIPFVQLRRIILQIAEDNGLEFTGGIENVDSYAYIPVANYLFKPEYNVEASFTQRDLTGTPDLLNLSWLPLVYDNIITDDSGLIDPLTGYFISPETANYQINFNLNLYCRFYKQDPALNAEFKASTIVYIKTSIDGIIWVTQQITSLLTVEVNELDFYDWNVCQLEFLQNIPINNYFQFLVFVNISPVANINQVALYHTPQTTLKINAGQMQFGNEWNVARNLPDIKQIDLLKYACVLGGFMFSKKDNTNEIVFTRYSDIVSDVSGTQDMSEYLDSFEIKDLHTDLSQLNRLKYKNDETVDSERGKGLLLVEDNTLSRENELYEAPFGASEMEAYTDINGKEFQVARYPYLLDVLPWATISPRIFRLNMVFFDSYFRHLTTTTLVQSKFVASFADSDLSFSNILTKSYGQYAAIVNDFKRISGRFYMTSARFEALDLTKSIYISQLGSRFIIEKTDNWINPQLCEIILIKI